MADFENINSASKPTLEQEIQHSVSEALQPLLATNGWRTYTGPQQDKLVEELSAVMGTANVGLTSSGSAALQIILQACRLPPGTEVMLSAYDYPGNFSAIENCGLRPVLVDVVANGWNLSLDSLNEMYSNACKVLIVSHLHGQLQDMSSLRQWSEERGVILLQDACQAIGATLGSQLLGTWADATVLSFGGSKTLSAGRGGAWCTSSAQLAQHIRVATGGGSGAYQLSEIQATMILGQLPFLDRITRCCRSYFERLNEQLRLLGSHWPAPGLVTPWENQLDSTAFYQAGWLLSAQQSTSLNEFLPDIRFAEGFDGFHRRSTRRCRRGDLTNCANVANRTITVHHRMALREQFVKR